MNQEANITIISYMYNKVRAEYMAASASYLNLPYLLAIPQGRPMTPFERLIKPFRYIIWSCFSSMFIFAILFIYYLRFLGRSKLMDFVYGQGNRLPFSNLLSTLFGGSVLSSLPNRNFARFILIAWLWYTTVMRTAYSGQLYNILQDGKARNTMSSFQEVVNKNYTIYAFPAVEKVLKFIDPQPNTGQINAKNTVPDIFAKISEPNTKNRIALCLLEYSIRSYNQLNPTRRVEMLREPLITSPIVFYMPLYSYLREQTGRLILSMLEAGIMQRFESIYLYAAWKSSRKLGEPTKLSFHLLLGIFSVYACLLLVCVCIFLLETYSRISRRTRILVDFLNF